MDSILASGNTSAKDSFFGNKGDNGNGTGTSETDSNNANGTGTSGMVSENGTPVDIGTFGEPPEDGGSDPVANATVAKPFIAVEVDKGKLDADLNGIEDAFATNNPEKVMEWVHPAAQEHFRDTFTRNKDKLNEIAVLMKTRKPVFVSDKYAEYEVTDNGKTYTVTYQKSGEHWMLTGL